MKRTYSLTQQYIASALLISLCLQSCGGGFDNNPLIPTREDQIASIQTHTQERILPTNIQPLINQQLTAQGGHAITFYEEEGQLKADVAMNAHKGFSKTYMGLEVAVEKGTELVQLPRLDTKAQQHRIHLQLTKGNQPAKIVIYKGAGLMGGMLEGTKDNEVRELDARKAAIQYNIGVECYKKRDYTNAAGWFEKAAELGHMQAQFNLSIMYYQAEGLKKDVAKSIEWLEKSAKLGYLEAQYNLGVVYYEGDRIGQDYIKAREWLEKAALQGHARAQYGIGFMYYSGEGMDKDYKQAKYWFKKATKQGNVQAEYSLGLIYYSNDDINKKVKALECFENALEQIDKLEDLEAQFNAKFNLLELRYNLGVRYHNGRGVEQDYTKAKEWYEKALQKQEWLVDTEIESEAQFNLGTLYYDGLGVEQNYKKAFEWYQKAAERGHSRAQYNLSVIYYKGQGLKKDIVKAIKWLEESAKQGDIGAQYELGTMYYYGKDVKKDTAKAKKYLEKVLYKQRYLSSPDKIEQVTKILDSIESSKPESSKPKPKKSKSKNKKRHYKNQ
jgi:TPR repeat protein